MNVAKICTVSEKILEPSNFGVIYRLNMGDCTVTPFAQKYHITNITVMLGYTEPVWSL